MLSLNAIEVPGLWQLKQSAWVFLEYVQRGEIIVFTAFSLMNSPTLVLWLFLVNLLLLLSPTKCACLTLRKAKTQNVRVQSKDS